MELVGAQGDVTGPRRRGRGRPKLYDDRRYVNLTAEQRADLEALAEANQRCLADEIREAIDEYRKRRREAAMPA
jgi:predicted phage gp36 major capsid-like protein